jgi:hypothetical protein
MPDRSDQVQHRRLVKRHDPFPVLAVAWKVKDHMHGNKLAEPQEIRLGIRAVETRCTTGPT